MRLLDLYCGAGGAAMGYSRAGFEVVGVDIAPQKHYPFAFIQADALDVLYALAHGDCWPDRNERDWYLEDFDAIHASPPCQAYSRVGNHARANGRSYPQIQAELYELLNASRRPWVIENVPGAPLTVTLMLCGSMFDPPMSIRRHRIFESNVPLEPPTWACRHALMGPRFALYEHYKNRLSSTVRVNGGYTKGAVEVMEIDWMNHHELTQAVPPRYAEFIGRQLLAALQHA